MARCPECEQELREDATECERCGRDLTLPEISEDRYRASLRDRTCVVCGGRRPWWSRLAWGKWTWGTCEKCGAQNCRRCKKAKKDSNALTDTITYSWTCRYCRHQHERSHDQSWADTLDD